MKKINVYLKAGAHPIYSELIKNPPSNVKYSNIILKRKEKIGFDIQKKIAIRALNLLPIPRMFFARTDANLIHSTRGILILNKKPWVMDIENVGPFVNHRYDKIKNPLIKSVVEKYLSSQFFKKLMSHSEIGGRSITSSLDICLEDKLEVLYPTTTVRKVKRKENERTRILFVGRYFYQKGAHDLLEAFKILRKKYDVELVMISDVPEKIKDKHKNKNITFLEPKIERDILFRKFYATSDIFVYPTYFDTSAFVVVEAMSTGLPVITTNIYAIPEYVENEISGLLIESPLMWHNENGLPTWKSVEDYINLTELRHPKTIRQIVEKTSLLIEDNCLRKKIGRSAEKTVATGKLSIIERNKKLEKIYKEALER